MDKPKLQGFDIRMDKPKLQGFDIRMDKPKPKLIRAILVLLTYPFL
jgi:hypothetical protein